MINKAYLSAETQAKLREHYYADDQFYSVSMAQFFTREAMVDIVKELQDTDFVRDDRPIMYRRSTGEPPETLLSIVNSDDFMDIVEAVTKHNHVIKDVVLLKYGHSDYQIIHDHLVEESGLDIIIDLTPEWDDDYGGFVTYTDGEGDFYTLSQQFGTVSLVYRDEGLQRFVKYVNHHAENLNRYFVFVKTEVER